MGKRPTNATKGGKFMNPTDQARKEARRRELKKNKKQRIMVRNAVLKGKKPQEILEELEKIDDMEYNPVTPCPLNQKVMSEKRRKLMETWDRVFKMYEKDAPDQYEEVKKHWTAYQSRKIDVIRYYESVMAAKDVEIDAIPLPNLSTGEIGAWDDESNIPLPPTIQQPPKSLLKKQMTVLEGMKSKICPGVPPGMPPSIQEYEDLAPPDRENRKRKIRFGTEEEDADESSGVPLGAHDGDALVPDQDHPPGLLPGDVDGTEMGRHGDGEDHDPDDDDDGEPMVKAPQPNSLQRKMLEMAGQDLDQFMKEMEEVHKQKEAEKEASLQRRLARLENEPNPPGTGAGPEDYGRTPEQQAAVPSRPGVPPPGVSLPPGLPPGHMPPQPVRPGVPPPGVRMPPGPPPGVPPSAARPLMPKPLGVLSAKPQINKSEVKTDKVIASAPVMRNLKSDVTRFVPTNLRVKRDDRKGAKKQEETQKKPAMFTQQQAPQQQQQQKTKDDAYNDFMKEMKDLI